MLFHCMDIRYFFNQSPLAELWGYLKIFPIGMVRFPRECSSSFLLEHIELAARILESELEKKTGNFSIQSVHVHGILLNAVSPFLAVFGAILPTEPLFYLSLTLYFQLSSSEGDGLLN